MRFDTVIIGGGLSGLVCGLRLQKAGKKCAIISAGQSAMHFSSGTFDLLGRLPDGTTVENPLEALDALDQTHPYSVIGKENVAKYAAMAPEFLKECRIKVSGDAEKNGIYFLRSDSGTADPDWHYAVLEIDGTATICDYDIVSKIVTF